jgi:ribosome recycling factor
VSGPLDGAEERMKKVCADLRRELGGLRAGRASPALVERIHVDYYGAATPVRDLAALSVPEPRLLVIQPWDRSVLPAIERALQKSDLGITPTSDGQVVRLAIPQLSEERRKDLVKQVHRMAEEHKVALRNVRRDVLDDLKARQKRSELSEDEARRLQETLQKLVARYEADLEEAVKDKEREVLTV